MTLNICQYEKHRITNMLCVFLYWTTYKNCVVSWAECCVADRTVHFRFFLLSFTVFFFFLSFFSRQETICISLFQTLPCVFFSIWVNESISIILKFIGTITLTFLPHKDGNPDGPFSQQTSTDSFNQKSYWEYKNVSVLFQNDRRLPIRKKTNKTEMIYIYSQVLKYWQ